MVICGVLATPDAAAQLQRLGVKDSKQLSPAQRENLAHLIRQIARQICFVRISPQEIDAARRQDRGALNKLEARAYARIIRQTNPAIAYMDLPQVTGRRQKNPQNTAFCRLLRSLIGPGLQFVAENHADQTYPIVMAASILAKVERDAAIEALRRKYGDFGSGYPSDPKTKAWLKAYFRQHGCLPDCVRHTWKTVADIIQGKLIP